MLSLLLSSIFRVVLHSHIVLLDGAFFLLSDLGTRFNWKIIGGTAAPTQEGKGRQPRPTRGGREEGEPPLYFKLPHLTLLNFVFSIRPGLIESQKPFGNTWQTGKIMKKRKDLKNKTHEDQKTRTHTQLVWFWTLSSCCGKSILGARKGRKKKYDTGQTHKKETKRDWAGSQKQHVEGLRFHIWGINI